MNFLLAIKVAAMAACLSDPELLDQHWPPNAMVDKPVFLAFERSMASLEASRDIEGLIALAEDIRAVDPLVADFFDAEVVRQHIIAGRFDEAQELATKSLPQSVLGERSLRISLAICALNKDDLANVLRHAEAGLLAPNVKSDNAEELLHGFLGEAYFRTNKREKARKHLELANPMETVHWRTTFYAFRLAIDDERSQDVERLAKELKSRNLPEPFATRVNAEYLCSMALANPTPQIYSDAVDSARKWLDVNPESRRAQILLVDALRVSGRYAEALGQWGDLPTSTKETGTAQVIKASILLRMSSTEEEGFSEAIEITERLLADSPEDVSRYIIAAVHAEALVKSRRIAEAKKLIEELKIDSLPERTRQKFNSILNMPL